MWPDKQPDFILLQKQTELDGITIFNKPQRWKKSPCFSTWKDEKTPNKDKHNS